MSLVSSSLESPSDVPAVDPDPITSHGAPYNARDRHYDDGGLDAGLSGLRNSQVLERNSWVEVSLTLSKRKSNGRNV